MADNKQNNSRSGAGPIRSMCRKCCGACANSISPMTASTPAWQFGKNNEADISRDESQRPRADAGRRRFRAVGIQFGHALSLPGLRPGFADLSAGAASARRRRPLAGLDAVDPAAGRPAGVLGAGAHAAGKARHGRRSRRMPTPRPCNGGSSRRSLRRGASSKAMQFTIADIALGAFARRWFGVEGITKPKLPNLERWFAQIAARPGFVQFIAPPMT